ncbi:hypothetical protein [Serratia marcescens]|uniref:hypothetical protein n=1 Tax=Serratia marcescens TaxID=615 RepID=UPI003D796622
MKEELYGLANHIAGAKGGLPQEWQEWADEIEMDIRKLANREAQPVYQYRMRNPYNGQVTDWETTKPEQVDFILKETIAANVEFRIIAAPPAPAVVKLPTEFYSDEGIVVRLEEVMAALAVVGVQYERKTNAKTRCECPAPAVPDELLDAMEEVIRISDRDHEAWDKAKAAITACRAAMLTQPVSSGYTLQDNVREALTLALQAMEFMGDTLNNIDAVCTEDVEYVAPAFNAVRELLAAVPEGGNGA